MLFHIGQQVVCISDRFSSRPYWRSTVRTFPRLGAIYTIRGICTEAGLVGLYLDEIINPLALFACGYDEPAFNRNNFRPLQENRSEINNRLLVPSNLECVD